METLLAIFGAKWCCVFASTMGGLTNGLVHTWLGWAKEIKNVGIAAFGVCIAAEFFIPMLVEQFELGVYTALAIAFFIGYSGIRLLPRLETQIFKRLDKVIGGAEEDKAKGEK